MSGGIMSVHLAIQVSNLTCAMHLNASYRGQVSTGVNMYHGYVSEYVVVNKEHTDPP